jgi:hypothetical protein
MWFPCTAVVVAAVRCDSLHSSSGSRVSPGVISCTAVVVAGVLLGVMSASTSGQHATQTAAEPLTPTTTCN